MAATTLLVVKWLLYGAIRHLSKKGRLGRNGQSEKDENGLSCWYAKTVKKRARIGHVRHRSFGDGHRGPPFFSHC